MINFADPSQTRWDEKKGDNMKKYVTYGVVALAALWLLKKMRIF